MSETQKELLPALSLPISNAIGAMIFAAHFLQPDPTKREEKLTTSVVVAVAPGDVSKFGSSIVLFSQPPKVEKVHSSFKSAQCRNCSWFGHSSPACKAEHPTCPLCGNMHTTRMQRCSNRTCLKLRNLKSVSHCCLASPLKCLNRGSPPAASDNDCPHHLLPPTNASPPSGLGDDMDQGEDRALAHSPPTPVETQAHPKTLPNSSPQPGENSWPIPATAHPAHTRFL